MSSQTTYDLRAVYQAAFGYAATPYPTEVLRSKTLGISPVGTIKSLGGVFKYSSKLGNEYTMPVTIDGYQIPQEPAVWIQGSKNVIVTPINRSGTNVRRVWNVIEEANLNNYQVRIRGIVLNEDDFDDYPLEAVQRMREFFEKPGSRTIESYLTRAHGINKVEIVNVIWHEVRGYVAAQAFELDCISDEDSSLELGPEQL